MSFSEAAQNKMMKLGFQAKACLPEGKVAQAEATRLRGLGYEVMVESTLDAAGRPVQRLWCRPRGT